MNQYDFGIVGLGVMGRNLLLNIADHGFAAAGMDLDAEKAGALEKEAKEGQSVKGTTSAEEFVKAIKTPRAIMLLVPAGKPVDSAINSLLPFLEKGDIVIDGGNTYFPDTDRRVAELAAKEIHFFGMGISGGEKGARFGPSMMPGGDEQAYERLRPIFEAIAAKVNGEPCVTYLGRGSAGNYVKMVHNGIEYGIMQMISEVYDLLKRGAGLSDDKLQQTFAQWNQTELQSFLVEITGEVLNKVDDLTGDRLVNVISDQARAKGTGKWTSQNAMDLQAPVPVIDAAVTMRDLSKYKQERVKASKLYSTAGGEQTTADEEAVIEVAKDALYFAMITTYAQGLAQLQLASKEYNYGLNLEQVAKIWRGGCIIRAACLEDFRQAFSRNTELPNILLDEQIAGLVSSKQENIRKFIKLAVDKGIPVPALMASLGYFDAYRSATLPTNLVQAQRDYFGAHQYERTDREGVFHTRWD
ncbi:NADP-dependent phosphogluconate dehydrogenase [Mucilaginibacter sp. Bleaf8]|uniref:NADP-dependent phosphogluconate dehydrogenase n=1 Tax=Mucilaginibacter sp. Bleaf8 TaxID=2834430 RepID=UPI001BCE23C4|nr:NADP-dependent phosphogluconate dehydrogenase [Mucilaginibacter sp. Bleaf8]MBS7563940.1 NADP-dependent phosphogluconate dehydrogenase [Mucilaginibacter sp. Bleaf8]